MRIWKRHSRMIITLCTTLGSAVVLAAPHKFW